MRVIIINDKSDRWNQIGVVAQSDWSSEAYWVSVQIGRELVRISRLYLAEV